MPKYQGYFYCLDYLHFFPTENKRESHKKVCENIGFCNFEMPSEDTKILEFNNTINRIKVMMHTEVKIA